MTKREQEARHGLRMLGCSPEDWNKPIGLAVTSLIQHIREETGRFIIENARHKYD